MSFHKMQDVFFMESVNVVTVSVVTVRSLMTQKMANR